MDSLQLTNSPRVREGLTSMLTAVIGDHGYDLDYVELPVALLVVEVAKRADDRKNWFPHGKWATIQAIQERIDTALEGLFQETDKEGIS